MVLEILYAMVASVLTIPFVVAWESRIRSDALAILSLFIPALVFFGVVALIWEAS